MVRLFPHTRLARRLCYAATGLLLCACTDEGPKAPQALPRMSCEASFAYAPEKAAAAVAVLGDFNGFSTPGLALAPDKQGVYRGRTTLNAGRYAYRFRVDGEEVLDPANPLSVFLADGTEASLLNQPDCLSPELTVLTQESTPTRYTLTVQFVSAADGAALDPAGLDATLDGTAVAPALDKPTATLHLDTPSAIGKHRLRLTAKDVKGRSATLLLPFWTEATPFAWKDAVLYQVIVDRFRRGAGALDESVGTTRRMGGDYPGLRAAIEDGYFKALGVTALWISPAYQNAQGLWPGFDGRQFEAYHGYWPIAAREVEPAFGGAFELDKLVDAAHKAGLRLLLDVVPNHVHLDHPYWKEHRYEWFNSPNIDCVCGDQCSWGKDLERCWFTSYLPDLDWKNRALLDGVLPDFAYWATRFDFDGFRVDACPMMPRLFTRHLRDTMTRALGGGTTPFYLIGETFTGSEGRDQIRWYLGPYGLSGQFDFPILWSLRKTIAQGAGALSELLDESAASSQAWEGSGAVMGLILGNHDMPRFLSLANGDDLSSPPAAPVSLAPYKRLLLAHTFIFSSPGLPVIYYGDEIGLPGAGDPDNRRAMRFGTELSSNQRLVLAGVKRLAALRQALPAARSGSRSVAVRESELIAYWQHDATSAALIALNRTDASRTLTLPLPNELPFPAGDLADCLGSSLSLTNNSLTLVVPPLGAQWITDKRICHETEP